MLNRCKTRLLLMLPFLVAATVFQSVAAADDNVTALAARIQVLEDREEIRNLILVYGAAHDHRDYRTFAKLFAREGEWVSGMGSGKGPDGVFKLMDEMIGHNPSPEGSGTFHILTNEKIDIDGDRASALTKWIYITPDENGNPGLTILGHYNDQFIREDGVWKFLRREAPMDLPTQ
ncbi:MAG: hypothetical protein ACI934_000373 [Pseudohongiellaceae bacterium]|jgi:hypothetical protein